MTDILFIGQHFPPGLESTLMRDTRGRAGFSNHNFETALLRGLGSLEQARVRAITLPLQYSWPRLNSRFRIRETPGVRDGVPVRTVGYPNLPGMSILGVTRAMARAINEELEAFDGEEVEIMVNTPLLPVSKALKIVRKHTSKRLRTTLILPDIPSCVTTMSGMKGLKAKVFAHINKAIMDGARSYDRYVMLTEAMNDFFGVAPERRMVMEGVIEVEDNREGEIDGRKRVENKAGGEEKGIASAPEKGMALYTGSLFEVFGVKNLVDAFLNHGPRDAELWICGSGDAAGYLQGVAARNPRVKFLGLISTEETRRLQRRATVLVNPRPASGEYTHYSFPSKTLEYLAAGRPVVMNRLPGIPSEYDPYLIYPDDETAEAWGRKLREVFDMDSVRRDDMARMGQEFVKHHKTPLAQSRRILDFITGDNHPHTEIETEG